MVQLLLAAGVEYYHIDYLSGRKRFYGAGDEVVETSITFESLPPVAAEFNQPAVKAAIVDSPAPWTEIPCFHPACDGGRGDGVLRLSDRRLRDILWSSRLPAHGVVPGRGPEAEKLE